VAVTLTMYRGDDRAWKFTLTADGNPLDLTAATMTFTAKRNVTDTTPAITLDGPGNGIEFVTDGTDGQVTLAIPAAATVGLGVQEQLSWDIEVKRNGLTRTWPEDKSGVPEPGVLVVYGDLTEPGS
jgi:hypothetical protein